MSTVGGPLERTDVSGLRYCIDVRSAFQQQFADIRVAAACCVMLLTHKQITDLNRPAWVENQPAWVGNQLAGGGESNLPNSTQKWEFHKSCWNLSRSIFAYQQVSPNKGLLRDNKP